MAESKIIQEARAFQDALLAAETKQFAEMGKRWLAMEQEFEAQFMALALEIEKMRLKGETPSSSQVWRMERFRSLLAQAQRETNKYARYSADLIAKRKLEIAVDSWQAADKQLGVSFNRLPVRTFEIMAGMTADGGTLQEYLAGLSIDAVDGIVSKLGQAITQGWNPVKTARAMRDGLALGYERALRVARTEQLRAMRTSTRMAYEASGMVHYYKRLAAKNERTCIACLLEDGKKYPIDVPLEDHPNGRCTLVPCVYGEDEPTWETGEVWFLKQGDAAQRNILGPGVFEKWKSNGLDVRDLVKFHQDEPWGSYWKPVGAGGMAQKAAGKAASGAGNVGLAAVAGVSQPGRVGSGAGTNQVAIQVPVSSYAWGNTNLTPAEIDSLKREIAEVGFDETKNIVIKQKYDGVEVNGEILPRGEMMHTGYEHYLGHVYKYPDLWGKQTTYKDYLAILKKSVLDKNGAIFSATKLGEKQLSFIGGILVNDDVQYVAVVYRLSRSKWISGHIIDYEIKKYLSTLENITWLSKLS